MIKQGQRNREGGGGGAGGAWAPPNFWMGEPSPPTFADHEQLLACYSHSQSVRRSSEHTHKLFHKCS